MYNTTFMSGRRLGKTSQYMDEFANRTIGIIKTLREESDRLKQELEDKKEVSNARANAHAAICASSEAQLAAAQVTIKMLRDALERIYEWNSFPPTGYYWEDDIERPMSYSTAFGNSGERDYMRKVAKNALDAALAAEKEWQMRSNYRGIYDTNT